MAAIREPPAKSTWGGWSCAHPVLEVKLNLLLCGVARAEIAHLAALLAAALENQPSHNISATAWHDAAARHGCAPLRV